MRSKRLGAGSRLLAVLVVLGALAWQYYERGGVALPLSPAGDAAAVQAAFTAHRSGVWLETGGRVSRLLADDNDGSRHQRFILTVGDGHTVMVAHNIDLAERIPVRTGARLSLRGRYEWNERGGVIHWTHHDPQGREQGGWINWNGKRYE
ncbi:MAG: DUF3465 domain-containing protein [Pseudomonadota bacterium]